MARNDARRQSRSRPSARTEIPDEKLPFDHRKELQQTRAASKAKRQSFINPNLPAIATQVELHCPKIQLVYVKWFSAICDRATFLDHVARHQLRDASKFNAYLQEFDGYLERITRKPRGSLVHWETVSRGMITSAPEPYREEVMISGPRGAQLLRAFEAADKALRHLQFLTIMEEVEAKVVMKEQDALVQNFENMATKMRGVVLRCKTAISNERKKARAKARAAREKAEAESAAEGVGGALSVDGKDNRSRTVTRHRVAKYEPEAQPERDVPIVLSEADVTEEEITAISEKIDQQEDADTKENGVGLAAE